MGTSSRAQKYEENIVFINGEISKKSIFRVFFFFFKETYLFFILNLNKLAILNTEKDKLRHGSHISRHHTAFTKLKKNAFPTHEFLLKF